MFIVSVGLLPVIMGHIFFGDVVEHGGSHALPEIRNCCQMEF
jgi:hypothetical protein